MEPDNQAHRSTSLSLEITFRSVQLYYCALISWSSALGIKGEKWKHASTRRIHSASLELKKMCPCETRIVHTVIDPHSLIVSNSSIDPHGFTLSYKFTFSFQTRSNSFQVIPGRCMSNLFLRAYKTGEFHNFPRKVQSFTLSVI